MPLQAHLADPAYKLCGTLYATPMRYHGKNTTKTLRILQKYNVNFPYIPTLQIVEATAKAVACFVGDQESSLEPRTRISVRCGT